MFHKEIYSYRKEFALQRKSLFALMGANYFLKDDHKFNYLLNSDGPVVKVLARFFYLASLEHSSVKDS